MVDEVPPVVSLNMGSEAPALLADPKQKSSSWWPVQTVSSWFGAKKGEADDAVSRLRVPRTGSNGVDFRPARVV